MTPPTHMQSTQEDTTGPIPLPQSLRKLLEQKAGELEAMAHPPHHTPSSGADADRTSLALAPRGVSSAPPPARAAARRTDPPPPYRPFPVDELPEPLRSSVAIGAASIGCPPEFIAGPLLAGVAAAIGNRRTVRLARKWHEPAVIWTACVSPPGTLKTAPFEHAIDPLDRRQRAELQCHREAMKVYDQEKADFDRDLLRWRQSKNKTADRPSAPEQPVCTRYIVQDTTVEALAARLEQNPMGLLLARDELSGWVGSFNQYRSGAGSDAQHYLVMHRAGSLTIDRKSIDKPTIYIPRAAVSICGNIQTAVLRRIMTLEHKESGLLARFLLMMPPPRRKRFPDDIDDADLRARVDAVFDGLLRMFPNIDENGYTVPIATPLSAPADQAFRAFCDEHEDRKNGLLNDDLRAHFAKLEGYCGRFALLFHFVRLAAHDPRLSDAESIDAESMHHAIQLTRWFADESTRVYAALVEKEDERDRRKLADLIQVRGGRVLVRDLVRNNRMYASMKQWEAALEELAVAGLGHWDHSTPSTAGGRPARYFVLNSYTPADETPRGASASEVLSASAPEEAVEVGGQHARPKKRATRGK